MQAFLCHTTALERPLSLSIAKKSIIAISVLAAAHVRFQTDAFVGNALLRKTLSVVTTLSPWVQIV